MSFKSIVLGTSAVSFVSVLRLAAQFFVIPVLSRLLSPGDYGLVAMALPFVFFTMGFTDAGMGQSLVRTTTHETHVWSTSFWLTFILGGAFTLLIAALSPVAAWFFHEPHLMPILLALSTVVVMQAGATVPEAYLRKNNKFWTIALTEAAAIVASIASAVIVALNGGGAWALVAQQVVLYGGRLVLTLSYARFRPEACFDIRSIREHLIFGRDVLGANMIYSVSQAAESFSIGKILGSLLLGIHTMAFTFVRLPMRMITGPLQYVLYSHLSAVRGNIPLMRQIMLTLTRVMAILLVPAIGMVGAAWHPVFKLFLSEKWVVSGAIFVLAVPGSIFQSVGSIRNTILLVMGRTDLLMRQGFENMVLSITALMIAVWFGIEWVAIAYNVVVFLYFHRSAKPVLEAVNCSFGMYLRAMALPAVVTLAGAGIYTLASRTVLPENDWIRLGTAVGIGLVCLAASVGGQYGALRRDIAAIRTERLAAA
jgi:O-antigen/teichoic acid export membrane protein